MAEKQIIAYNKTKKSRTLSIGLRIGIACLLIGILCLIIRAVTGDRLDENGLLQEYFFLIPTAFAFFFCGVAAFLISGIRFIVCKRLKRNRL